MQLHLYAPLSVYVLHNPLHVAHNSFNVVAFAGKASSCCNANANAIWHVACGRCKVATRLGLVALHKGHGAYACVCVCAPTCGNLLGYKLFIAYCSMPPPATPHSNATVCCAVPHLLQLQPTRTEARRELAQCTLLMQQKPASSASEKKCQMKGFGEEVEGGRGGGKVEGGSPLVVDSFKFK